MADERKKPPPRDPLFYGSIFAFFGSVFLLISFCSPYWLRSYAIAYMEFKNMGLWEFCFDNFHYPHQQQNVRYSGCDHVYSFQYRAIREWMLPDWLQGVQALVCVSLLLCLFGLATLALILMKLPLSWWRNYQYEMAATALCAETVTVLLTFLAVIIFGAKSWDREWIMYPQYNYFSWAFYLAVFSVFFHAVASACVFVLTVRLRRIRSLQPRPIPMRSTSRATTLSYQYHFPSAPSVSPNPYQASAHQAPPTATHAPPTATQAPPPTAAARQSYQQQQMARTQRSAPGYGNYRY